jgi:hypothetical protein
MRRRLREARTLACGLGGRDDGSIALEFALLFPLMVLVCIGMAELVALAVIQQRIAAAGDAAAEIIRLGRHASAEEVEIAVETAVLNGATDVRVFVTCGYHGIDPRLIGRVRDDRAEPGGDDGLTGGLVRVSIRYEPTSLSGRLLGDRFSLIAERYAMDAGGAICR